MDITVPIQIKVDLAEGKNFSVGNVAAAVRGLGLDQKVTEAVIPSVDQELVENWRVVNFCFSKRKGEGCPLEY